MANENTVLFSSSLILLLLICFISANAPASQEESLEHELTSVQSTNIQPSTTITSEPKFSNGENITVTNTNLAPIDAWDLTFGSNPQYAFIDTAVTRVGNSIRVEPDAVGVREVNTNDAFDVVPGDRVVYGGWIKTGYSSTGKDGNHWYGGRYGIDLYNAAGEVILTSHPTEDEAYDYWVPFATSEWTYIVWDFIIPDTYFSEDWWGNPVEPAEQVAHVLPWMQGSPYTDTGDIWFVDPFLYINPSDTTSLPAVTHHLLMLFRR